MASNAHRVVSFGSYTFPQTEQKFSDNFAEAISKFTRIPGYDGGFDEYGRDRSPSDVGRVQLTYVLLATSDSSMRALRDSARAMRSFGVKRLTIAMLDGTQRFCRARIKSIQMPEDLSKLLDRRMQTVTITWEVSDPTWALVGAQVLWGSSSTWGGGAVWGAAMTVVSGLSTNYNLNFTGVTAPSQPILYCTCTGVQTATNPTFTWYEMQPNNNQLSLTRHKIRWLGTLNPGDDLMIDCRASKVLFSGADAYNEFEYHTPEWIEFNVVTAGRLVIALANSGDAMNFRLAGDTRYV